MNYFSCTAGSFIHRFSKPLYNFLNKNSLSCFKNNKELKSVKLDAMSGKKMEGDANNVISNLIANFLNFYYR